MESENISRIIIPSDVYMTWERNFSFLGTFLQAQQHIKDVQKCLGVSFSMCAFFHERGQVQFFRSKSDENNEGKIVGKRCLQKNGYTEYITKNLIKKADLVEKFLENENKLTKKNVKKFFILMNNHFVFHHAIYWAADYISKIKLTKSKSFVFDSLQKAREYDELILPKTEEWLLKNNSEVLLLTPKECAEFLLNRKRPSPQKLKSRNQSAFVYINNAEEILLTGKKAERLREIFVQASFKNKQLNAETVIGKPAFGGKYKGTVRTVIRFENFRKLKKGEVLVAPMTMPYYNHYIKNAGAIIVDEGSVLSHASILARELKIPCIIGTKIATQVLKDGDLVEVDAGKGVVKIVKN